MTSALERLKAQRAAASRPTRTISVQLAEYKLDRLRWDSQVDACTTLLVMDGEKRYATMSSPGRTPDDPYSNDDVHALMTECEAAYARGRSDERAAIALWLGSDDGAAGWLVGLVERGRHLVEPP